MLHYFPYCGWFWLWPSFHVQGAVRHVRGLRLRCVDQVVVFVTRFVVGEIFVGVLQDVGVLKHVTCGDVAAFIGSFGVFIGFRRFFVDRLLLDITQYVEWRDVVKIGQSVVKAP